MNKLTYNFHCLDGYYHLEVTFGLDKLNFLVETSIDGLVNNEGELSSNDFINQLNEANLESWNKEYNAYGTSIEDATTFDVTLEKDGKTYSSKGEESYEPYKYELLIKALMILDPQSKYLLFK